MFVIRMNGKQNNLIDDDRYIVHSFSAPRTHSTQKAGLAGPAQVGTEMAKARDRAPGWIRFMLNRKGLTFADVDRSHGLKTGIACVTTRHPHEAGEKAIADALGLAPQGIWPSRFNPETGARLRPQPMANYRDRQRLRTSQKRKAA